MQKNQKIFRKSFKMSKKEKKKPKEIIRALFQTFILADPLSFLFVAQAAFIFHFFPISTRYGEADLHWIFEFADFILGNEGNHLDGKNRCGESGERRRGGRRK